MLLRDSSQGKAQIFDWLSKKKNGELFWVEVSLRSSEIRGEKRTLAVVRHNPNDNAERLLHESEERLRLLSESTYEGIAFTEKGIILDVNARLAEMLDYTHDELIGKKVFDMIPPESRELVESNVMSGTEIPYVHWTLRKDGTKFLVEARGHKTKLHGREVRVTIIRDLTASIAAEEAMKKSEEKYKKLFETAGDSIFIMNHDEFIDCNEKTLELFRCTRGQIIGRHPFDFSPLTQPDGRDSKEKAMEKINDALAGTSQHFEWTHLRPDGTTFIAEVTLNTIQLSSGTHLQAIVRDITERKKAEETLRASEERYRGLYDGMMDAFAMATMDGRIVQWNRAFKQLIGYSDEEIQMLTYRDITPPQWHAVEENIIREQVLVRGHSDLYEKEYRRKDGTIVPIELRTNLIRNSAREPLKMWAIIRDVSERKRTEKIIRLSEEKLKASIENTPNVAIQWYDLEGKILSWNNASEQLYGWKEEEAIGKTLDQLIHTAEEASQFKKILGDIDRTGKPYGPYESTIHHRNGKPGIVLATTFAIPSDNDQKIFVCMDVDITEQKKAEEELRESEERFRIMFDNAANSIALVDIKGRPFKSNPAFQKMLGYSERELAHLRFTELTHPEDRNKERQLYIELIERKRTEFRIEQRYVKKDGSIAWGHLNVSLVRAANGDPIFTINIIEDVTEQQHAEAQKRKLEEQLLHAQKMDSIGRLAGGIAHDFNNMLTPILGYGELLAKTFSNDDPRKNRLQLMVQAALKSKNLVAKLLAFARKQQLEMKSLNLNAVTTDFMKILHRALRENISVRSHFDPSLNNILGDAGQIEQIILNLAINAQDAMPDGGILSLETSNIVMKHDMVINNEEMKSGDYAVLAVSDTGSGIDPAILPQIFEPFFTTKEKGKGTGLGLSTVYGIVKQHNGYITVYSQAQKGTTFKMYFPLSSADIEQTHSTVKQYSKRTGQNKKIFVVEDQEQILELVGEVLAGEGYAVSTASTVLEAQKKFQPLSGSIDLLISDVILPDGNGKELYDRLALLQPGLKVLFMSSYTEDIISRHTLLSEGVGFISKPFSLTDFTAKVAAMVA